MVCVVCLTTSECVSQGHLPAPQQESPPFPGSPAHTFLSSLPPFLQEEPRQEAADSTACDLGLLTLTPSAGLGGSPRNPSPWDRRLDTGAVHVWPG